MVQPFIGFDENRLRDVKVAFWWRGKGKVVDCTFATKLYISENCDKNCSSCFRKN